MTAVLLLTAMGLLVAASVLASRPYEPSPRAVETGSRSAPATGHGASGTQSPDPC